MGTTATAERAELAAFVTAATGGSLVLRGETGSALLARAAAGAEQQGRLVLRATGVEAESALPYAGLHQLLHPLLTEAAQPGDEHRAALGAVFAAAPGEPPSVLAIGVAVLGLLTRAAAGRPLLLAVDDGQWLDDASAEVCGFVGRRLAGGRVQLLIAVRPDPPGPRATGPGRTSLTCQEHRIADLAASGLTNRQIGERMHLSPRTVGSHLYRVFPKLGITTRAALRDALGRAEQLSPR
ncbi:LuxR C-terminal-related transcriptional regulator [Kitasatospora sp. NPDC002227]|uniref:helix-turn-helix transcriptional regulator n=1 Tax=Kitasatospora sp. NPDC002227 TaxID=3154773 RepID=UPI0033210D85